MIVTGIRNYTPIRQGENFVGNGRKKDVPDNRKKEKVLFTKADLKALEKEVKEVRNNPEFLERLKRMKEETEEKIRERRESSIVPPEKMTAVINI